METYTDTKPLWEEEVIEVEMMPEQKERYQILEEATYKALRWAFEFREYQRVRWLVDSLSGYPDGCRCCQGETVYDPLTGKQLVSVPPIRWKDAKLLPKEKKLLEILKNEISKERRCLIYARHRLGSKDPLWFFWEWLFESKFEEEEISIQIQKMTGGVEPASDVVTCQKPDVFQTALERAEF